MLGDWATILRRDLGFGWTWQRKHVPIFPTNGRKRDGSDMYLAANGLMFDCTSGDASGLFTRAFYRVETQIELTWYVRSLASYQDGLQYNTLDRRAKFSSCGRTLDRFMSLSSKSSADGQMPSYTQEFVLRLWRRSRLPYWQHSCSEGYNSDNFFIPALRE